MYMYTHCDVYVYIAIDSQGVCLVDTGQQEKVDVGAGQSLLVVKQQHCLLVQYGVVFEAKRK